MSEPVLPPGVHSGGLVQTSRLALQTMQSGPVDSQLPRLLFLGGSNTDFQLKAPVFSSPLVDAFNVLAYEPRGLGRSESPGGNWTMEDYAHDAIALLDTLGWQKVFVVGESFGAMTAMEVAIRFPQRIEKLCLMAAAPGGDGGSSYPLETLLDLPARERAITALSVQDTRFIQLLDSDMALAELQIEERMSVDAAFKVSSNNAAGYPRLLAARSTHDVFARLPLIRAPTLVMSASNDNQAPLASGKAMADKIPDAQFLTFQGGHGFAFASPAPSNTIINRWCTNRE